MERNSFRTAAIFEATSWGWSGSAGLSDRNHSRRFTMLSVLFQAEFGLAAEFCSRHNGCACCTSPQVQIKATNPWHKFFLIYFCIRAGCTYGYKEVHINGTRRSGNVVASHQVKFLFRWVCILYLFKFFCNMAACPCHGT